MMSMTPLAGSHGYDLLRAPAHLEQLRGLHLCTWTELLNKFELSPATWEQERRVFYLPRYRDAEESRRRWAEQGLTPPIPLFHGSEMRPSSTLG